MTDRQSTATETNSRPQTATSSSLQPSTTATATATFVSSSPNIPGILIPEAKMSKIQLRLNSKLFLDSKIFPGAQPISFNSSHLNSLLSKNYFCSEKADGIRVLFYTFFNISESTKKPIAITYLIDRKNNYYEIPLGLPHVSCTRPINDTLIDGELVYDVVGNTKILYFLAFDCIMCDSVTLYKKPYGKRLGALRENILAPLNKRLVSDPNYKKCLPFQIRLKKLEASYNLNRVFDQMTKNKHESDGIMFTSESDPYVFGTCVTMVKWKPSEENTVDFKLNYLKSAENNESLGSSQEYYISLYHGNRGYIKHSEFHLDDDTKLLLSNEKLDNRIIECKYDPKYPFSWKFTRFRDDKEHANHISTFEKVMISIKDNVTRHELLEICDQIRINWKSREKKLVEDNDKRKREEAISLDISFGDNPEKKAKFADVS